MRLTKSRIKVNAQNTTFLMRQIYAAKQDHQSSFVAAASVQRSARSAYDVGPSTWTAARLKSHLGAWQEKHLASRAVG